MLFRIFSVVLCCSFIFLCVSQNFAIASPFYPNAILVAEDSTDAEKRRELEEKAKQGDANAQVRLGLSYIGDGAKQNYQKAKDYFAEAAEQGNADAQYYLGCMYQYGDGVKQDFVKAKEYLGESAKQGYAKAKEALKSLE